MRRKNQILLDRRWAKLIYDGLYEVEVLASTDRIAIVRKLEDGRSVATFPENIFHSKEAALAAEVESCDAVLAAITKRIVSIDEEILTAKRKRSDAMKEAVRARQRRRLLMAGHYKRARIQ